MIVKHIRPRGFCKGVYFAIEKVKEILNSQQYPRPIYVLGYIVHNKFVVDELKALGAVTLDDKNKSRLELIDEIDSGTVIISAHGTPLEVIEKIKAKGLNLVDATCKDVYVTHDLINAYLKKDFVVLYIGKKNHPETNASLSLGKNVHLVESVADVDHIKTDKPLFVTNQTTFSIKDILPIHEAIKKQFPKAIITEEICNATRLRQNAIIKTNKNVDLCYIVGDKRSNNSKNLVKISENFTNTKTILIQSAEDIKIKDLENIQIVSVSSGASTPEYLTKAVIDFLENYQN